MLVTSTFSNLRLGFIPLTPLFGVFKIALYQLLFQHQQLQGHSVVQQLVTETTIGEPARQFSKIRRTALIHVYVMNLVTNLVVLSVKVLHHSIHRNVLTCRYECVKHLQCYLFFISYFFLVCFFFFQDSEIVITDLKSPVPAGVSREVFLSVN